MDFYEKDMYPPVATYFSERGYMIRGEVKGFDLTALKDDTLVIVEFKKSMNLTLILQGMEGLKITSQVYLAIPRPKNVRNRRWLRILRLCEKIQLGLITVGMNTALKKVDIILEPGTKKEKNKKRDSLMKEMNNRSQDYNVGGSSRTKMVTAYRENCIHMGVVLSLKGPLPLKSMREITQIKDPGRILSNNFYGWFERIQRGVYGITEKGLEEMKIFPKVTDYYRDQYQENGK